MSHVCYCGWSGGTYHGLRTHQGKKGCTPKGLSIPKSDQYLWKRGPTQLPVIFNAVSPTPTQRKDRDAPEDTSLQVCHCGWSKVTSWKGLRIHQGKNGCTAPGLRLAQDEWSPARGWPTQSVEVQRTDMRRDLRQDLNAAASELSEVWTKPVDNRPSLATIRKTEQSSFGNYHVGHPTSVQSTMEYNLFEALCSTGLQVQSVVWEPPTPPLATRAIEKNILFPPGSHGHSKYEDARALEWEGIKTKLACDIQVREKKAQEICDSAEGCKQQLKREKREIKEVFAAVRAVVEQAEMKALQPLEERAKAVEKEAMNMTRQLQKEIQLLKSTIFELEALPGLMTRQSLQGQNDGKDWTKHVLNASITFGTMKTTTSSMLEEIEFELERLSSIETKRIPKFVVDVQLDQQTANPRLVLSHNGKQVRDGVTSQSLSCGPDRFDRHGSVLALNRLVSGKSYWEVEVGNKTGWDLGITKGDANRKGQLELNPLHGYWVIGHFVGKQYVAMSDPYTQLFPKVKPKKVGVFVDYEEGLVSFYDVETRSHIYSFTKCGFTGELRPYFSPHLRQGEVNASPLIISPVKCR